MKLILNLIAASVSLAIVLIDISLSLVNLWTVLNLLASGSNYFIYIRFRTLNQRSNE